MKRSGGGAARARFEEFGDSSLVFAVVYSLRDPDYDVYMDTQQASDLAIFERFARAGVEFACPTRTLHFASLPAAVS
jgi:small-conductance mechanosensitive channel